MDRTEIGGGTDRGLLEFARRFWQVMSGEAEAMRGLSRARYWEYVSQLSHLKMALDEAGEGADGAKPERLLVLMRRVLDGFGGRRADSEPYRREQSVEERRWYVQWSEFSGHRRADPAGDE